MVSNIVAPGDHNTPHETFFVIRMASDKVATGITEFVTIWKAHPSDKRGSLTHKRLVKVRRASAHFWSRHFNQKIIQ
jgi:hypothetical protein